MELSSTPGPYLPAGAKVSPAAARNREPILNVLRSRLPSAGLVLEIASGTGEHVVHNAAALPHLQWQPTDADADALESIAAWRRHAGLTNVLPPFCLDASDPLGWQLEKADTIVAINMIHISPWEVTQGLMEGAGRVLGRGGMLFFYGPFIENGLETALSNLAFDASLRDRNQAWGVRHLDDVTALAAQHCLALSERISMPANNLSVVFRKT